MARFEIEIDDTKGELLGEVPEPVTALLKKIEAASHGQGYGKGVQKAAEDAKAQIEANVRAEVARREAALPAEREKWARVEAENQTLSERIAEQMRENDKTLKAREEKHAREIIARTEALKTRDVVLQGIVAEQLEGLAMAMGAREESLPELRIILNSLVGYDDDGKPYVQNADKTPRLHRGEAMTLKTLVKDYLDTHPHHKRPASGVGGGARGGASFQRGSHDPVSLESARKRIDSGDRSAGAINELFEASRKKAG